MEVKFDMTIRQTIVFGCLQVAHPQDFLLVFPIDQLGQHMSLVDYSTIIRYILMITLFPIDEICPICHKICFDTFREHTILCKELLDFKN